MSDMHRLYPYTYTSTVTGISAAGFSSKQVKVMPPSVRLAKLTAALASFTARSLAESVPVYRG